jgi:hypothetical protein
LKEYTIRQYQANDYAIWNAFVSKAKNATFLFDRDFMEYHRDRFEDFSLLVFEGNKLMAILPANRVGEQVFSHQGLTYGGLVYTDKLKLTTLINIFASVLEFLHQHKIKKIHVKTIPSIYHQKPSEELQYALFLSDAKLIRRDSLSVIDFKKPTIISKGRIEGVNKGIKNNLVVVEEINFDVFWNKILIPNLEKKHQAKPVHSLHEIKLLHKKFPNNIRQFNVYLNNVIVAGTTIFESDQVAHAQYISANETKNEIGSLDFLYHHLIKNVFENKNFLDFGTSNENQGRQLNQGLCFWKESFGACTIIQDFYEVETCNYTFLESVLL